jgi:hypothetical protein
MRLFGLVLKMYGARSVGEILAPANTDTLTAQITLGGNA